MALSRPVHGFESRRERHIIKDLRGAKVISWKRRESFGQPFEGELRCLRMLCGVLLAVGLWHLSRGRLPASS